LYHNRAARPCRYGAAIHAPANPIFSALAAQGLFRAECGWLEELGPDVAPTLWIAACAGMGSEREALHVDGGATLAGALHCRSDALPFPDAEVRGIALLHALEVPGTDFALLRECVRVLAPGTDLLVFGVHPMSIWHGSRWLVRRNYRRHLRVRWPARMMWLLRDLGLGAVSVCGLGMYSNRGAVVLRDARSGPFSPLYAVRARKVLAGFAGRTRARVAKVEGSPVWAPTATTREGLAA
jgi:hypothetical protein